MATWKEDIVQALYNLNGKAHLSNIYKEVEKLRKDNLNPTWDRTVQRELESNSSDSEAFLGKEDIFYSVEGKGKGVWGLRDYNGKFAIAPTDLSWFRQLRTEGIKSNIINFWTPTPWNIKQLSKGNKLYFMLKSPIRKIGGYGKFFEYKNMSISEAWNNYGRDNGVESFIDLKKRTSEYLNKRSIYDINENSIIGCILLEGAEFFNDEDFLSPEKDMEVSFPKEVVKIKYFEHSIKLNKVTKKISENTKEFELINSNNKKIKTVSQKERKGQNKFRNSVLKAYNTSCLITGVDNTVVLEAAHIQPYINEDSNNIQNGICLRVDIHKLFDNGLITIDQNYNVFISPLLKNTIYEKYNGKKINLPNNKNHYPSLIALKLHKQSLRK